MYEDLLSTMHEIVGTDCNSSVYEMKSVLNTARKIARFKMKNDRGIQFALWGVDGKSKANVIVQPCQQPSQHPYQQSFEQPF